MFKAPIKMLHPLLTATQEGNYVGSENIGAIPFTGIMLAHSNESEWRAVQEQQEQRGLHRPDLRDQGALLRCASVRKRQIYEKLVRRANLRDAPLRAGNAGDAGQILGAVAPEATRELEPVRQDARL
jgi:serine protein kinase